TATRAARNSKTSCIRPDRTSCRPKSGERPRSRLRLPGKACGHGEADVFEAGEHNAALGRTGAGAPEFDLKGPEQSLELRQREVPQLAAGDDLRHPFLLFVARPRRSGPFLRPGV